MNGTQKTPRADRERPDDVLALLTEQCGLCRQLSGLGDRQRSLITADQPEELLGVLAQRQRIIDRLGSLSQRMRPYQQDWARVRARLGQDDARRADELVSELNTHLAGILAGDKADADLLASRRLQTGSDMSRLKTTRIAGAAYAASQEEPRVSHVEWTDE